MKRRLFLMLSGLASVAAPFALPAARAQTPASTTVYAIVYRRGPNWREGLPMSGQNLRPHLAYMQGLFDAGVLYAGGAIGPEGGLALIIAADAAEAARITNADPAVTMGVFAAEVHPWARRFSRNEPLPWAGRP
jgi:uncharacterized protein YciI